MKNKFLYPLFFSLKLYCAEQSIQMSEIEPALSLIRSESVRSFIVHDNIADEKATLFTQTQKPSVTLTQKQLYRFIFNGDHASITFYRTIIPYELINGQSLTHSNLRPLAYAALHQKQRRVFQALFLCGADPDFKEKEKKESFYVQLMNLYITKKKIEVARSARYQIRILLQQETKQNKQCYLLKVLRNLNETDPQCTLTWKKGVKEYAQERGVELRARDTYHIPVME